MKIILLCLCLAGVGQYATAAINPSEPMIYRYWDWSITSIRDDYQIAALTLALEKTLASHGPYQIVRVREAFPRNRILRELQTGENINVYAAPARAGKNTIAEVTESASIAVKIPLMSGLLGYRRLIVRKDDLEKFRLITDANQLKSLIAGQGENWEDVHVYRHNGYAVNDAGNYLSLTNMLYAKRFDYLPMGIIEVENLLASAEHADQLALVDNLLLYYPLPLYFYVSKPHPELAARLERGLQIAGQDGSLDALLEAHFAEQLALLKEGKVNMMVLKNPAVPDSMGLHKPKLTSEQP